MAEHEHDEDVETGFVGNLVGEVRAGPRAPQRGPSAAIRAERERQATRDYQARWAAFRGLGNAPVVLGRGDPARAAWLAYFRAQGLPLQIDLMQAGKDVTVPCRVPADFDQAVAVVPDRRFKD